MPLQPLYTIHHNAQPTLSGQPEQGVVALACAGAAQGPRDRGGERARCMAACSSCRRGPTLLYIAAAFHSPYFSRPFRDRKRYGWKCAQLPGEQPAALPGAQAQLLRSPPKSCSCSGPVGAMCSSPAGSNQNLRSHHCMPDGGMKQGVRTSVAQEQCGGASRDGRQV